MNQALLQQVQRLGELRQQRQALEAQEQQLVLSVRGQMAEHGIERVCCDEYEAVLINQERLTVDAAAFQRAVNKKDFLRCVSVGVQAARELLGDIKLRKISTVTEAVQLRVSARARQTASPAQNGMAQRQEHTLT